ncbi:MAG TPA: hypothetical protein VL688_08110 [Verrucomicrobiae bacterium]|jgi:hypothetical protein|nr:hypothetical protein [Verrucomicrobiae bacterium]
MKNGVLKQTGQYLFFVLYASGLAAGVFASRNGIPFRIQEPLVPMISEAPAPVTEAAPAEPVQEALPEAPVSEPAVEAPAAAPVPEIPAAVPAEQPAPEPGPLFTPVSQHGRE